MQIKEQIMAEITMLTQKVSNYELERCRKKLELSSATFHKYMCGEGAKIEIYQLIINHLYESSQMVHE